jgi:hypothetical protein
MPVSNNIIPALRRDGVRCVKNSPGANNGVEGIDQNAILHDNQATYLLNRIECSGKCFIKHRSSTLRSEGDK